MESEETIEGGTTLLEASSTTGEARDSMVAKKEHHAPHASVQMSPSPTDSAKEAELNSPQDCFSAPGQSAEMLSRTSNSVQKVSAGLEEQQSARRQRGLSECEGEILLEEGGLDCTPKLDQVRLVDLERNQDSSSPSTVEDGDIILQALDLSPECPQCQVEQVSSHSSHVQAQCPKSPLPDFTPSQREPTKCFVVCKTISEGHYKAEPFLDKIVTEPLQEFEATGEQQNSTKVVPATDEQAISRAAAEDMAKPNTSEDAKESIRTLQGQEGDTESSHHVSSNLIDDSQGSSLYVKENISANETRNSSMAKEQGTVMIIKQNSSISESLSLEEDGYRKLEGRPASPILCAIQTKDAVKKVEKTNGSQHKQPKHEDPELDQAVYELQQAEQEEKETKFKQQNLREKEESKQEPKDQKNKEGNELEQELPKEELDRGALLSAFSSQTSTASRHRGHLSDLKNVSSAEQTEPAFLPEESVSESQQPDEDALLTAFATAVDSASQPAAASPLSSISPSRMDETPVMSPCTCRVPDQAANLEDSGRFSISGQDSSEADWDDKTRLSKEDEHSDGHEKKFDKRNAPLCEGMAASFSAENLEASVPAYSSSGTKNLKPPDPTDVHPITENMGKSELQGFIPVLHSEITSLASTSGPQKQDDDDGTPSVSCEDCPGGNLDKLPGSVERPVNQAALLCVPDLALGEKEILNTDSGEAYIAHELLTSGEGFHEEFHGPSSFSVAYMSSPLAEERPSGDGGTVSFVAGPLESPQTPDRTSTPLSHPETIQQYQNSPEKVVIIQGTKMEENVGQEAQKTPFLGQCDWNLNQEEPGSRISSVLSNLTWPSEEATVIAVKQQGPSLSPAPESSLPLVFEPDAEQLPNLPSHTQSPSQDQAPALNENYLGQAPDLDSDQPPAPVPFFSSELNCAVDNKELLDIPPTVSHPLQTVTSVSDSNTVASAPDAEVKEKDVLVPATKEWDLCDSGTQDTENCDDSGVVLLSKNFSAMANEPLARCSDTSPETTDQYMDPQYGKSSPDDNSWPSLESLRMSTDSKNRDSIQPLPMLAFTNPIHFLRLSPPSPPTTRTTCEEEVSGEMQWMQQADIFTMDTKNISALAMTTEKTEAERRVKQRLKVQREQQHSVAQPMGEVTRHSPLEKSSSWPDKKLIRVVPQEPVASQENPVKRRVKSKDWHRQGLKRISIPSDILQEISAVTPEKEAPKAHREPAVSSETVIMREKKPADARENFKRRHSKLINSSRLLYQEYSDVVLNKAIQNQKRVDSFSEDIEPSFPSSPRLRRKVLSPQDSYLQRLSVSSNASLWQDIPMIRGSRMLLNMSHDEQKLQEAKFELIMSEASYLRSLNVAVDHFQRSSELQAVLTNQERQWLFSRLQDVRDVSASFLFDLEEKFEEDMFTFHVCDVALKHAPEFRRVYLPYVTNQTYQEQTFQRLLNGNAGFQQVLERLESDPVCQRLSLKSFLILPFQRITRLKLLLQKLVSSFSCLHYEDVHILLQNILKRTRPGSEEEVQATQAYDALEKLIKDCNENVQRMKSTEELIYLSQKIEFECKIFPLISQSRRLVKCGELTALDFNTLSQKWKVTTRPIYLHLFNDCLLLSRPKEGGRFVVFDHAAFSDVRGEKCEMKLHGTNKNVFRLFLLQNYQGKRVEFLFRTETQSEKLRWISALAPPRGELDLLECPDAPQVQCIRTYKARENDELALEKADIIMVMQSSTDGWMEGVKLSDRERGWFPSEHVELISSKHARQKNLKEEERVKNAKQQVFCNK